MVSLRIVLSLCMVALFTIQASAQQPPSPEKLTSLGRNLSDFGPTDKPPAVQETYGKAIEALRATGGLLVIPADAWQQINKPKSLQGLIRTPSSPAETKQWREGPGVTVITQNDKQTVIHVPPFTGLRIERMLRLDDGDSVPHWGTHSMVQLDSKLIYGSISYLDWIQADVEKGPDRRFYVPTVRGLVPGQFINVHGHSGYGGGVTRACIKSLGFDEKKKMHYFVADTSQDHKAGAIAQNKSNTGILHMTQNSNADNQTYDVKVIRNQYAHGDTYIYYCDFNYMSNVHSAAGDENGNCYAAFIRSLDNNFKGSVDSYDVAANKLVFANSAANVESLGNSRPLINLNPAKHITTGKVLIVPGRSEFDQPDPQMSIFEGKNYATELIKNPITGATERKFGGLIRGDKDCNWDDSVVGRFFAVDEKSEKTPKGNYRWYLITKFTQEASGNKEIEIQRFWWGAKSAGSPTLYRNDNYTWDGHEKPLGYIIAPGTYVNDVSRALAGGDRGGQRILGLAPFRDGANAHTFEKGDKLEQAIGPDPFKPEAMRVWMWEDVPGQYPAAVLDAANHGAVSRYSVISVAGGPANLDDVSKRHEPKPAWDNVIVVNTAATVGLNLKADFATAAILFQQPNREQPIKWQYGMQAEDVNPAQASTGNARPMDPKPVPKMASLTVSREDGEFQFEGNGVNTGGAVSGVKGISGDGQAARNLRGKNVKMEPFKKSAIVKFPAPEVDENYAVFLELSWLTERAIANKTREGFTIQFSEPVPADATLDWMLIR
jgi:hypothetical protein